MASIRTGASLIPAVSAGFAYPWAGRSLRCGAFLGLLVAAAVINPTVDGQNYLFNTAYFEVPDSTAVIVADFNGDGRLDLAVANATDNSVSILLGMPGGSFAPQKSYSAGSSPLGLAVADFNGDGKLDLAFMNSCVSCTSSP